jgi:hypothetical protein
VQSPVNAACTERTQRMRKPLKSSRDKSRPGRRRGPTHRNGTKGRFRREADPLPLREKLWKRKLKGVTGVKQSRRGCGRNKASRG